VKILYEWDYDKDLLNQKRHNISFSEAVSVFDDPKALSLFDSAHSQLEDRWIELGRINSGLVCVVVHTFRNYDFKEQIRIISARKATKSEEMQYYIGV
jgi:uncharacterized DUF497 family protein